MNNHTMKVMIDKSHITERSMKHCLAGKRENDIKLPPIRGKRNCGKTDTRRSSIPLLFLLFLCFFSDSTVKSESLWSPAFKGYILDSPKIQVGDTVVVKINSDFTLSLNASSTDSKGFTFEYSGGEFGNILSFLPKVSTNGTRSMKGSEQLALKSNLVARAVRIDPSGQVYIEGNQIFSFEGKEESLSLSGYLDPRDLNKDREVPFSKIAESRIVFRSVLQPAAAVLGANDIVSIAPVTLPEGGPASLLPSSGLPSAGSAEKAPSGNASYSLTPEKKKELFIRYINQLIDLLF